MEKKFLAIGMVAILVVVAAAAIFIGNGEEKTDEPVITDAAGNTIGNNLDASRLMTVGVGTLRWVSYFDFEDNVVCIDAGDANNSSWNGKGYRSLFDFDSAKMASIMKGSQADPMESHVTEYGMAIHDHNTLSSNNLQSLSEWKEKPTLAIVSKSVYDGFSPEFKNGLSRLMDVVVIYEVDEFVDGSNGFSKEFESNLSILGTALGAEKRANDLKAGIVWILCDIADLVKNRDAVYDKAYIGGTAFSGSKSLRYSVGDYLPFNLAGITNSYANDSATSVDTGSDGLSQCNPDIMFLDLSGTGKFLQSESEPVRKYAEMHDLPVYTLLPYFWFGYNFDNAIANAYFLIYACYNGVLTYDECIERISNAYEVFMPGAENLEKNGVNGGEVVLMNMNEYYSKTGSKLVFDGTRLVSTGDSFVKA